MNPNLLSILCAAALGILAHTSRAAEPFYVGADVSMLPELEKAGAVYTDGGKPGDAITILRRHGVNLFRLRLFVDPTDDFSKSYGATQDLATVRALAKRVRASGAAFLLDLHYSDTWADPGNQRKPAAWADLHGAALERKVHDYTADVLAALKADGAPPDLVQVGNEVTPGMIWPDGRLDGKTPEERADQWRTFAGLVKAGVKAVREASAPEHPIRVMIHIDGGDRAGLAKWWFDHFQNENVDYDLIGLSFYPAASGEGAFDHLKANLADAAKYGKGVIVAEVAYPHRPDAEVRAGGIWPATPAGQAAALKDVMAAVKAVPGGARHDLLVSREHPDEGAGHLDGRRERSVRRARQRPASPRRVRREVDLPPSSVARAPHPCSMGKVPMPQKTRLTRLSSSASDC